MAPKIYRSILPPVDILECSAYPFLFPKVDLIPSDSPAFIDGDTGVTLTRGELRVKTLEFAHELHHSLHAELGGPMLVRGGTILVFSPNNVAYPIVVLGHLQQG